MRTQRLSVDVPLINPLQTLFVVVFRVMLQRAELRKAYCNSTKSKVAQID